MDAARYALIRSSVDTPIDIDLDLLAQAHQRKPGLLRAVRARPASPRCCATPRSWASTGATPPFDPALLDPREGGRPARQPRRVPARRGHRRPSCASRTGWPATWRTWPATTTGSTTPAGCCRRATSRSTPCTSPGCGCARPPARCSPTAGPARGLRPRADVGVAEQPPAEPVGPSTPLPRSTAPEPVTAAAPGPPAGSPAERLREEGASPALVKWQGRIDEHLPTASGPVGFWAAVYARFARHRGSVLAGGLAFFALLSLVPSSAGPGLADRADLRRRDLHRPTQRGLRRPGRPGRPGRGLPAQRWRNPARSPSEPSVLRAWSAIAISLYAASRFVYVGRQVLDIAFELDPEPPSFLRPRHRGAGHLRVPGGHRDRHPRAEPGPEGARRPGHRRVGQPELIRYDPAAVRPARRATCC